MKVLGWPLINTIMMRTNNIPKDDSRVRFRDIMGTERAGIYKKESHGYVEISEVEMPEETKFLYPEHEVVSWEYAKSDDTDMTKFVL